MGFALRTAQECNMDPDAKVLQGFGGAGVLEVAERFDRSAYRSHLHRAAGTRDLRAACVSEEVEKRHRHIYAGY
ncbi:MAG: hypothetical protein ACR2M3_14725 [Thermomicrobiales bacterium]